MIAAVSQKMIFELEFFLGQKLFSLLFIKKCDEEVYIRTVFFSSTVFM